VYGMGRFKGGLRCKGKHSSVSTCRGFVLQYKYNVKTFMYTISALYQMINLNAST